jgi:hypothetical protein
MLCDATADCTAWQPSAQDSMMSNLCTESGSWLAQETGATPWVQPILTPYFDRVIPQLTDVSQ